VPEPFCTCGLSSGKEFFRTKAVEATINPEWNFQGDVSQLGPTDSLIFTIKDSSADDTLLGKGTLEASQFNPMGFDGDLILAFSGRGRKSAVMAKIKLRVTLCASRRSTRASQALDVETVKSLRVESPTSVKSAMRKTRKRSPQPTGPWCWMVKLRGAR